MIRDSSVQPSIRQPLQGPASSGQAPPEAGAAPHPPSEAVSGDRLELSDSGLSLLLSRLTPEALGDLTEAVRAAPDVLDLVDRLGQPNAMDWVDSALDLTPGRGGSLLQTLAEMTEAEAEAALQALARLLKHGVIGYEYREVNGQPMKVFIDVAIGSDWHRAPLVRGERLDRLV